MKTKRQIILDAAWRAEDNCGCCLALDIACSYAWIADSGPIIEEFFDLFKPANYSPYAEAETERVLALLLFRECCS